MAGPAPSKEFKKLRLNTQQAQSPQDYPFASSNNADHVASSAISSSELLSPGHSEHNDQTTRTRGSSVSFREYATVDDGRQHSLDQPLPRSAQPRRRSTRDSIDSHTSSSAPAAPEDSPYRINPFTGEPIRRRTRKSEVAPRLQTIDSADAQQLPSLTSASSGSLLSDQLRSPDTPSTSYFMGSSAVASPSPAVSPSIGSEPWSMFSRKTLSRTASLRNTGSRRSSRMSGSSMSPASAFLSQFARDRDNAPPAPEPDDEGQPIGLEKEYVIGRQIGAGGFSVIKEVVGMNDDGRRTRRAVKITRKTIANVDECDNEKHQQAVEHELGIWRYLQHEHIMTLHVAYETDFATFCIMDLVESGSLYDLVLESRKSDQRGLSSKLAKTYAFQLARALRYLHEDIRLVHRDIKLENCLVQPGDQEDCGTVKLCDFGLADFFHGDMTDSVRSIDSMDSEGYKDPAGTLEYAAPELITSTGAQLHPSADIWAFGVCVYTMVTGNRPFAHSMSFRLAEMITAGKWDAEAVRAAPAGQEDYDEVYGLLCGCLNIDPEQRWTIADVMSCKWFADMKDLSASNEDWQFMRRPSES